MITDLHVLEAGPDVEADLCILGAGAAGITLAREFIGTPLRIVLCEGGGMEAEADTQDLYAGEGKGQPYFPLEACRLRMFGGSTNHWNGACSTLLDIDFEERPWIPYSGWPIRRDDLLPYYRRASEICGAGEYVFDEGLLRFQAAAQVLELAGARLQRLYYQRSKALRFGARFGEELRRADNILVLLHANAVNLQTDASGQTVEWVDLTSFDGARRRVRAKVFALCCGGLENARLLLASNRTERDGIGNRHGLVGRFFMDHLVVPVAYPVLPDPSLLFDNLVRYRNHSVALVAERRVQQERRMLNSAITLEGDPQRNWIGPGVRSLMHDVKAGRLPRGLGRIGAAAVANVDFLAYDAYRAASGRYVIPSALLFRMHGEQAPNPDSRVTLSDRLDGIGMPRLSLDWRLSEIDRHSAREMVKMLGVLTGHLGIGRVRMADWLAEDGDWPSALEGAYHHIGTTRMSQDPRRGVVDRECRVHGMSNFYIAGSSVFPTSGGSTPTMTIVALALRLADTLRQRQG